MGMDVYGRNESSKEGNYFRANVWSWRPIHVLICEANERFDVGLSDECLAGMSYNDGAGPETQEPCTKLADAIERMMSTAQGGPSTANIAVSDRGIELETNWEARVADNGEFIFDAKPGEGHSPYSVSMEHLAEFCTFLRACGGFQVF